MTENRIYNFNAGPAALPLAVLQEIQDSFLNLAGSGMSITEVSHRSPWFDDVINDAIDRTRRLLKIDDKYKGPEKFEISNKKKIPIFAKIPRFSAAPCLFFFVSPFCLRSRDLVSFLALIFLVIGLFHPAGNFEF